MGRVAQTRVGLALGASSARLLVLRGGRVVFASEAPRDATDDTEALVETLLRDAPLPQGKTAPVGIVFGLAAAAVKCVSGLPPITDPETIAELISESRDRFFPFPPEEVLTTGARSPEPGRAWVGVLSASDVAEVRSACIRRGLRPIAVAPLAVGLAKARPESQFEWLGGSWCLDVVVRSGEVEGIGYSRGVPEAPDFEGLPPGFEALGERAPRFLDALGAALLSGREALSLGPDGRRYHPSLAARRRLRAPLAVAGIGAVLAMISPLAPLAQSRDAEARVAALDTSVVWQATRVALEQNARVVNVLDAVSMLRQEKADILPMLDRVGGALPTASALVRFQLAEDRITLTLRGSASPDDGAAIAFALGGRLAELANSGSQAGIPLWRVVIDRTSEGGGT